MLLIVQIIIAIGGVVALFNGEFKVTKKIVLYGNHARVVGAVALMQATLTLVLGLVLSAVFYDTEVAKDFSLVFLLIQIIFVMSPFIVGYFYKDKSAYDRESLPIPGSISTYPADAPTLYNMPRTTAWPQPEYVPTAYPVQIYGAANSDSTHTVTEPGVLNYRQTGAASELANTLSQDGKYFYYPYPYPTPD